MVGDDLGFPRKDHGQESRRWGWRQAEFPADVSAAGAARALVREICTAWGLGGVVDDAVLVVSELVSNAIDHARSTSRVMLSLDDRGLVLAVRDFYVCEPPRPKSLRAAGTRGRGLFVVSVVSSAWGVEEHADGKTMWAVLTPPEHWG
jgi:anti-sigma regulatory factor (Ser/Thr protein kinase)